VQAAIELSDAISTDGPTRGAPADAVVQSYFRARRFIGAKDRSAIAATVYGILRTRAQLDWWIARAGSGAEPGPRPRTAAFLGMGGGWTPEMVEEHFDGERFRPRQLTPAERALLRAVLGRPLAHPEQSLGVRHNIPDWIAPRLAMRFGEDADRELEALA